MPRNAKRAQPVRAPQDQAYGQSGEQMAAQRSVPLPDMRSSAPAAGPGPVGAGVPPAVQGQNPTVPSTDPRMAAMSAAAGVGRPPALLARPSQRPTEPITAGLPGGPGPGPEAFGGTDRVAATLDRIATLTGDPKLRELAERARMMGR